jgi:mannose/cellobiose epimerase-like protein (N-acyl-D-glucosamine 2-epimerase family)
MHSKPINQKAQTSWVSLAGHRGWLQGETERLLQFTKGSRHPDGGFAWLDGEGVAVLDRPVETWITTRMTHVLSIGALLGIPGCGPLIDYGVTALQTTLRTRSTVAGTRRATDLLMVKSARMNMRL